MICDHAEGSILSVRAQPRARRVGVMRVLGGALKIGVSAPPEDGRANAALIEILSRITGARRSQIELLSGQTSRDKRFLIRGLNSQELRQRLAAHL